MKKIIGFLFSYIRHEVKIPYLLCIAAILAFFTCGYYGIGFPAVFYQKVIRPLPQWQQLVFLFGGVYVLAFVIQPLFGYPAGFLKKKGFWLTLLFAVAVYTLRMDANWNVEWVNKHFEPIDRAWWYKCSTNLMQGFLTVVPLLIFWFIIHRKQMPFYGFSTKEFEVKPYVILLLLMVPLVALASTQADFLAQYPRGLRYANENGAHPHIKLAIFEFLYGLDFVAIELFFRGFLIMAMVKYCGRQCILPMAAFYMLIHFGKPLGETVSSFFGGTLLGILALETRSIYGGIMVHLGIAWLMELGAIVGRNIF